MKEKNQEVRVLESKLLAAREEVVHLHPQLASTRAMRDHAFGYAYGASMLWLWSHLLANPRADLRRLYMELFILDATSLYFVVTFSPDTMPHEFDST